VNLQDESTGKCGPQQRDGKRLLNSDQRSRFMKGFSMGDKSPKATQKKNSQKQAKAASSDSKKREATTAQQATKLKAEAAKKK
jgi:hypothetical protein